MEHPKWEYLRVDEQDGDFISLFDAGNEGWELCAVRPYQRRDALGLHSGFTYIFKRPKI